MLRHSLLCNALTSALQAVHGLPQQMAQLVAQPQSFNNPRLRSALLGFGLLLCVLLAHPTLAHYRSLAMLGPSGLATLVVVIMRLLGLFVFVYVEPQPQNSNNYLKNSLLIISDNKSNSLFACVSVLLALYLCKAFSRKYINIVCYYRVVMTNL